jgi:hypothetical protein
MIDFSKLPNLFILGAAKCGTTTLAQVLSRHPDIFVPKIKEVSFFNEKLYFDKGIEYYKSFFKHGRKEYLRCDASPQYLYCAKVPKRMYNIYGDRSLKFIVILRNPIDRVSSSYKQAVSIGGEQRSQNEVIREELDYFLHSKPMDEHCRTMGAYIGAGLYGLQIKRWFLYFPKECFKIIILEDLVKNPQYIYQELFNFLNVENYSNIDYSYHSNKAVMPRYKFINYIIRYNVHVRSLGRIFLPRELRVNIRNFVDYFNMRENNYKIEIDPELLVEILDIFKNDVKKLENITGLNFFENWFN